GNGRLEGMVAVLAPVGQEPVDADGVHHGAGKDMGADLPALFQHHNGEIGIKLLQPDGRGKTGRAGADDHHVELHAFALYVAHLFLRIGQALPGMLVVPRSIAHQYETRNSQKSDKATLLPGIPASLQPDQHREPTRALKAAFEERVDQPYLHDAWSCPCRSRGPELPPRMLASACPDTQDRKSTRLNSSHVKNSYAVFCLKKKT